MLAPWLIASRRLPSLEVVGDNAAHMCLIFYTSSTQVSFICPHVSSTLLPTLHYLTVSLNGLPPPDDDDKQGKNMSPYLIHTGNWQQNCRKECRKEGKKKKAKKVKIKKPAFVCHSRLLSTHFLSFSFSQSISIQSRFNL